jgi:heptosyltransferase-2
VVMKIVVRAPNWLGDVVLSFPAIENLRKNLPQAQTWIAAREEVQDLYLSFDFVKGIIPLSGLNNFKNVKEVAKKIKEYNFDIGLLLTNSFSSALLFYLAKIPQRWGYSRDNRGFLLTKGVPFKNQDEAPSHQVNYYLNLISGLGFQTSSPELVLPLSPEEQEWVKNELSALGYDSKKPLVIINPGAYYGPAKRWPASRFAELASMLQEKNKVQILIVGSAEEAELAESIASSMSERPINMTGKTTLRQLAELISLADLFITNDSGPMHITNALRIPLIAIFGPTDPRLTGPFHQPAAVIKKEVLCWPCSYRKCPFDHRCMTEIDPVEIFTESQNFL